MTSDRELVLDRWVLIKIISNNMNVSTLLARLPLIPQRMPTLRENANKSNISNVEQRTVIKSAPSSANNRSECIAHRITWNDRQMKVKTQSVCVITIRTSQNFTPLEAAFGRKWLVPPTFYSLPVITWRTVKEFFPHSLQDEKELLFWL